MPLPWFDRTFRLDLPLEMQAVVLERLRGTPARLEENLSGCPDDLLTQRLEDRWSVQENAGHLVDLEELWAGRTDDFLANRETLREADLSNRKTHEAGHNESPCAPVLAAFRGHRQQWLQRLESLSAQDFARSALHPRLSQPMRLLDLCFFVAEHDDHHLSRITQLKSMLSR
jgi:uncharacterized damage-inducible protein DinB